MSKLPKDFVYTADSVEDTVKKLKVLEELAPDICQSFISQRFDYKPTRSVTYFICVRDGCYYHSYVIAGEPSEFDRSNMQMQLKYFMNNGIPLIDILNFSITKPNRVYMGELWWLIKILKTTKDFIDTAQNVDVLIQISIKENLKNYKDLQL